MRVLPTRHPRADPSVLRRRLRATTGALVLIGALAGPGAATSAVGAPTLPPHGPGTPTTTGRTGATAVPRALPGAARAAAPLRRCGRIDVPSTQATAAVSLRGTALACSTVRRVVRAAYRRSVLLGDTRTFTVRDAGRAYRCRYAPASGGMVCTAPGRRLRGTI
ncbi:unannotated protein [freshwater metagenome]|uniref:Unannotated protein n=1 Tax=freshwater metagenome TaxID=449393 RepID=A0A6J7HU40_9ZZZZ